MDFTPLSSRSDKTKRPKNSLNYKNKYCPQTSINMSSNNTSCHQGNENVPKEMTRRPSFEAKLKERIRRYYKENPSKVSKQEFEVISQVGGSLN